MRLVDASEPWNAAPDIAAGEVLVAATREELAGLASCVVEALEAMEDWEFHTRTGLRREDARQLLDRLHEVLRTTWTPE